VVVRTGTDRLHGGPGTFHVVRCLTCDHMRTDPRPARDAMAQYYPSDYAPYIQTASSPGRLRSLLRDVAGGADTPLPPITPGKMLEIGTASGNFLIDMQRRGWQVTGLEWDSSSAERAARRTGATVLAGDAATVQFPDEGFDLICGWMVFEHLEDPRAAMAQCLRWLRPGGWLAFSVPDCGSWQFRFFGSEWYALQLPTHLHHFTVPVLRRWLAALGYQSVSVRWQGTLLDVPLSVAYVMESRLGLRAGRFARTAAGSLPVRLVSRVIGRPASWLRLTGRISVWAQKPW
jgi:SAM-dependent methyltransferase